jgi:hypothetical protein
VQVAVVLRGAHRKPFQFNQDKSQTGLRAVTFDSPIFSKSNMPYLNEVDFNAFVQLWAKEGQRMGTATEFIKRESLSKVARHYLATKT